VTEDACRIDVWLWRARFFKTRSLAARVVEDGGVRLLRGQSRAPLDKPSRPVRCGDVLSFAQGSRWIAVKVEALGERRGPAPEARALYSALTDAGATGADVAPKAAGRAVEGGDFNQTRG
jgi:ribosome-associated heat shock protein Hsp15